jgi:8-oxo-dGTP pyrophosphatase MutT (NUDIX family)
VVHPGKEVYEMKKHAVMVIKNEENKILFVKRSMKKKSLPGLWAFPSGTIKEREDINETLKRESLEELMIEISPKNIFAELELPELSSHLVFVHCEIKSGVPEIKEPDEIDRFEWMSFKEFFRNFTDDEIGHGLRWLRKQENILESLSSNSHPKAAKI